MNHATIGSPDLPSVELRTKTAGHFTYHNGFTGVTNLDLELLLQLSKETTASLEAELKIRNAGPELSSAVIEYEKRLRFSATNLKILGRLENKSLQLVKTAIAILHTQPADRNTKIYHAFLGDTIRLCGPQLMVLCAATLGKHNVANLNGEQRLQLLQCLQKTKPVLESSCLRSIAAEYKIPDATGGLSVHSVQPRLTCRRTGCHTIDIRSRQTKPQRFGCYTS